MNEIDYHGPFAHSVNAVHGPGPHIIGGLTRVDVVISSHIEDLLTISDSRDNDLTTVEDRFQATPIKPISIIAYRPSRLQSPLTERSFPNRPILESGR